MDGILISFMTMIKVRGLAIGLAVGLELVEDGHDRISHYRGSLANHHCHQPSLSLPLDHDHQHCQHHLLHADASLVWPQLRQWEESSGQRYTRLIGTVLMQALDTF